MSKVLGLILGISNKKNAQAENAGDNLSLSHWKATASYEILVTGAASALIV